MSGICYTINLSRVPRNYFNACKKLQVKPHLRGFGSTRLHNTSEHVSGASTSEDLLSFEGNTRDPLKWQRLGYSTRRVRLGEEKFSLPIDALGNPASVLVLNDYAQRARERHRGTTFRSVEEQIGETPTTQQLLQAFEDERGLTSSQEVFDNIEGLGKDFLREKDLAGCHKLKQCARVAKVLHDGFTSPQLQAYIEAKNLSRSDESTGLSELSQPLSTESLQRTAWHADTTTFPQTAIDRLDNGADSPSSLTNPSPSIYRSDRLSPKQKAVEQIIRRTWNVKIAEEADTVGELDIRIAPEISALVLGRDDQDGRNDQGPKKSLLSRLAEDYLARIDISRSNHLIRLTASLSACLDMFHAIRESMSQIRKDVIDITELAEQANATEKEMRFLGNTRLYPQFERMTNTAITIDIPEVKHSIPKLTVWSMGPETTDLDNVRKLLFQSLNPNRTRLVPVLLDVPKDSQLQELPLRNKESLPWYERPQNWARWISPISLVPIPSETSRKGFTEPGNVQRADPNDAQTYRALDFIKQSLINIDSATLIPKVQQQRRGYEQYHVLSAVPGLIAYRANDRQESNLLDITGSTEHTAGRLKKFLKERDFRRSTISPEIPNLIPTVLSLPNPQLLSQPRLRLRLRPSQSNHDASAPSLDIIMALDEEDKSMKLHRIVITDTDRSCDQLLPEKVADVRYQRQSYTVVDPAEDPILRETVLEFLSKSNLDLWGAKPFSTPFDVKLPIRTTKKGHTARETVLYYYDSLEHEAVMHLQFRHYRARYVTVEAGLANGRRQYLSIEMDVDRARELADTEFHRFYVAVQDIVSALGSQAFRKSLSVT
ncbi:hypothetical protein MMC25_006146 [Agyrium rufum]|nr:hypothetical protein [Agyrium rufum]